MQAACDKCKFWFKGRHECRRHAPTVMFNIYGQGNENMAISRFPQSAPEHWCGEFKPVASDTEEYEAWQYGQQ